MTGLGLNNIAYLAFHGPGIGLRAAMNARARSFTNPSVRTSIREDFPQLTTLLTDESSRASRLWENIQTELRKLDIDPSQPQTIYIAYPHKHPVHRPLHVNGAHASAATFMKRARKLAPHINWVMMDAIYERSALKRGKRTRHQHSSYAFSKAQTYGVDPSLQTKKAPFLISGSAPANFVVIDDYSEQGTTFASLISFLEANGGRVLAAAVEGTFGPHHLRQENVSYWERGVYMQTPIRVYLGQRFEASARKDGMNLNADDCLRLFEESLRPYGLSIDTLTLGEITRLGSSMSDHAEHYLKTSFTDLIGSLRQPIRKKPFLSRIGLRF